jgi:glycosyltransferase involved in cell wall biosynthesis
MPTVSIVIPTFNQAEFLEHALRSVLAQTYSDWQAIVVDNFSADSTVSTVLGIGDPRVRLEQYANQGIIAASRNLGVARATGVYVAFLDSDDLWDPEKLAVCVGQLDRGYDLVWHGYRYIAHGRPKRVIPPIARDDLFDHLLYDGNSVGMSTVVVRRNLLVEAGGFCEDPDLVTAEDYELWLRLTRPGIRSYPIRSVLSEYRVHPGNHSGAVQNQVTATTRVLERFLPAADRVSVRGKLRIRRRYANLRYYAARNLQHARKYHQAWPFLFRAIVLWPALVKAYAALALNLVGSARATAGLH